MNDSQLATLWEKSGYLSESKFHKYVNQTHYASHSDLKKFLKKQESTQLTRTPKKQKTFNSIVSPSPRNNYQIDIMIYDRNKQGGYSAILGCIDVFSRFAMCVPLKTRKQKEHDSEVMRGLRRIFKTMGNPKNINADNEFTSKQFLKYCEDNEIKLWLSYADEAVINSKNSIIERFWRTLARMIQNHTINTGDIKWYSFLDEVVTQYNNAYHSTIKARPQQVFDLKEPNSQKKVRLIQAGYKKGDIVRLRIKKKLFDKGDTETFSRATYEILERDKERANRWILRNEDTGKVLVRGYIETDFARFTEVVKPNLKKAYNPQEVLAEVNRLKRLNAELKQLEINGTSKLKKPKLVIIEEEEPMPIQIIPKKPEKEPRNERIRHRG